MNHLLINRRPRRRTPPHSTDDQEKNPPPHQQKSKERNLLFINRRPKEMNQPSHQKKAKEKNHLLINEDPRRWWWFSADSHSARSSSSEHPGKDIERVVSLTSTVGVHLEHKLDWSHNTDAPFKKGSDAAATC
uniref:Uncharacterized protein n=1 Tax=Knipowitschia caucasica TaxID=637954 RepID=A0AAV2JJ77_KNICA